jgi:hypothetical protein
VRSAEHLQALLAQPKGLLETLLRREPARLFPKAFSKIIRNGTHGESIERTTSLEF